MADYQYDNPDDAYIEAQSRIKKAKDEAATFLDFHNFGLISVPPEIRQLTHLRELSLDGNKLTVVPPEITQLSGLTGLYIAGNQLTLVPPEIGQLKMLKQLHIHINLLTAIPSEIGQLTELTGLYLDRNQLTSIPPEIGQLTKLTALSLNDNRLASVPFEIFELSELLELELSNNLIPVIPAQIGQLTNLTSLKLSKNWLTSVPCEIGNLKNLTELWFDDNRLASIPPEIGHLINLRTLVLHENQLVTLPSEIWELTELTFLSLSENQLTTIPQEIGKLNKLEVIALDENRLTFIPYEITQFTNLRQLLLQGNPKLQIPPEIAADYNNPQAIQDYLRERPEKTMRPLNEAKLILVGQGGVGKTSLVKRLLGKEFDEAENQTEGINIESWSLDVNRPQQGMVPITLNIWDFGGQEIMHATHQFFLTKRSLYLLVLDARQGEDEGRVEYWLALINSFAPDAPVLIVINKSDQHHLDINRRGLQEKYPAIKGFIRTSARSGQGIEKLKAEIAALLATMEHVDTAFPPSWMQVETDLVTMQTQRHFLPYDEYEDLCRKHGVAEESSQTTLVRFLHDLGIVLNFTDDDRVRDTSVLNPNWVTEGIYALLNSEQLQQKQGILVRNQVRDLLSHDDYPSQQRRFLLDMMTKFELAFGLPGGQTLLIPDLISKEQPEFEWDDANALQFAYQYSVLPRSILHRFMVRQHQRVDPEIRWRTGVMLHHEGFTALVKADIKAATIRISIIGEGDRRQFLYSLRLEFAGIHDTIQGTKPQEVVPIPNYPDADPIPYQFLLELEEDGTLEQRFFGVPEKLNVQKLLNGISTSEMRQVGLPNRRDVLAALQAGFDSEDEFGDLIFGLEISAGELAGDSRHGQMRELVTLVERHGRFQDLVTAIASKRPHLFNESRRL